MLIWGFDSATDVQALFDQRNLVGEIWIVLHLFLKLLYTVLNGAVIPVSKLSSEVGEAKGCVSSGLVHGDVSGLSQASGSSRTGDVSTAEVVHSRHRFDDSCDGEGPVVGLEQIRKFLSEERDTDGLTIKAVLG